MVLSLAHKHTSVSAPGHRGFLWHAIGGGNANMGHMAHLSRLPGSTSWGISISKEPVGARPRNGHKSESKEKAPAAAKTDFIWFKVAMPEGVGVSDSAGKNADRVQLTFPENENASADRFIPVWKKALTAEESHADQAEKKGDTFQWKDSGSVEYNGRTWLVGTYEDNSGISTMLFTDVEPGSVYVLVSNFDQHKKEAEALLNSIEFPDDMEEAVSEAREVEISSIEIK